MIKGLLLAAMLVGSVQAGAGEFKIPFYYDPAVGGSIFSTPGDAYYDFDTTNPTDGRVHRLTYSFTSADPNAEIVYPYPDQIDTTRYYYDYQNILHYAYRPEVSWYQYEDVGPLKTTITMYAERTFDFCNTRPHVPYQVCRLDANVWGNGTYLEVRSTAPVSGFITGNVPEPATWSLMIAGFGLIGASVRRRRSAVNAVAE